MTNPAQPASDTAVEQDQPGLREGICAVDAESARSPSTLTPHCSALHQRHPLSPFFLRLFSVPLFASPISGPPEFACSYLAYMASLRTGYPI